MIRASAAKVFLQTSLAIVLALSAATTPSLAQTKPEQTRPEAAKTLLALDHQPTVHEIMAALGGTRPQVNPFSTPTSGMQEAVRKHIPSVIAAFEKAFPGATFVALGRDSVFLGDILDAYYSSLGQNGRVVRIGASSSSTTNDADVVDYLKGIGFDLADFESRPPFIIFDQTFFNSDSQSTMYLRAIYEACRKKPGCDPLRLLEKFNVINTGSARLEEVMYQKNIFSSKTDMELFLAARVADLPNAPRAIISVHVSSDLILPAEYHDKFGRFTRLPDGRVITKAGKMSSDAIRLRVLADIFESIKTAESPEFHRRVQEEVNKLGYTFPVRRATSAFDLQPVNAYQTETERLQTYMSDKTLDDRTRSYLQTIANQVKRFTSASEAKRASQAILNATSFDAAFAHLNAAASPEGGMLWKLVRDEAVFKKMIESARTEGKLPETLRAYESKKMPPELFWAFGQMEKAETLDAFLRIFSAHLEHNYGNSWLAFGYNLEEFGWDKSIELLVRLFYKAGGDARTFARLIETYENSRSALSFTHVNFTDIARVHHERFRSEPQIGSQTGSQRAIKSCVEAIRSNKQELSKSSSLPAPRRFAYTTTLK